MKRFIGIAVALMVSSYSYGICTPPPSGPAPPTAGQYLVQQLGLHCKAGVPCSITLEPGVYEHNSLINLTDLKDVTINADGVEFRIAEGPIPCNALAWIKLVRHENVTFRGLVIRDLGSDSSLCQEQTHGITAGQGTNLTIDGVNFDGVGDECVQFGRVNGGRVLHSTFTNCVRESPAWAGSIVVAGGQNILIDGNTFQDNSNIKGQGIRLEASIQYNNRIMDVRVVNNRFTNLSAGVIGGVSDDLNGVLVDNNTFVNVGLAIRFKSFGGVITNILEGNNLILNEWPAKASEVEFQESNPDDYEFTTPDVRMDEYIYPTVRIRHKN